MTENLLEDQNEDLQLDPEKNYLSELVGEGKKFKTEEDLAKGKFASDHYIQTLERRLDTMRSDYLKVLEERNAAPKLQELIDRLDQTQQLTSRENPESKEDIKPAYDPKEVESLVSHKYQEFKKQETEQANFAKVENKAREVLGNNFKTLLKDKSQALGLTDEEVNSMARRNPDLFFKTFDLNGQSVDNFQAPPRTERRSTTFAPKGPQKRTMSYYDDLRRKDPRAWLDPKIAIQMEKDSQALGEAFFDV